MENVTVGIAEYKIVKSPNKIKTIGLGSCCGVILYDDINKIAGLVHILLPDSSHEKQIKNRAKYADTGIVLLYEELKKAGANSRYIRAKLAGGAHMFNFNNMDNNVFSVGEKNVKACKSILSKLNVSILGEDVLGSNGRTITFDTLTNKLHVKSIGKNEKFI